MRMNLNREKKEAGMEHRKGYNRKFAGELYDFGDDLFQEEEE
jgi:hypothetical protein